MFLINITNGDERMILPFSTPIKVSPKLWDSSELFSAIILERDD